MNPSNNGKQRNHPQQPKQRTHNSLTGLGPSCDNKPKIHKQRNDTQQSKQQNVFC